MTVLQATLHLPIKTMEPILTCKNVTVFRGKTTALDSLDLEICAGTSTAIVGPNGAGKSTLLKLITRELYPFVDPTSEIKIFGEKRWNVWELRYRLGIVSLDLQNTFFPDTTGRKVVLSGFVTTLGHVNETDLTSDQIARAEFLLAELAIDSLEDKPIRKMSTGQQRRFLLARALVHDPEALVFDEPTAGLDLASRFHYLRTVGQLVERGKTIVQVTHHIDEIPPEIDRVVLLDRGRILADGNKSDVLTEEKLSQLFGVGVRVVQEDGYYRALPKK